jgi:hypothetical protein
MWVSTPTSFVSAGTDARVLWSSAARGVLRATAAHEVRTVETHTPRHIGCILKNATTAQFEQLGANVHIDTVSDVSADVRMFENLKQENISDGPSTDMVYDLTITDSDATVYTARVYLDNAMLAEYGESCSCPMVCYALRQLDSIHESMPEVAKTLQRAFDTKSITQDTTASAASSVHCVASANTTNRRMFPIGSVKGSNGATHMLGTQNDKTVLFNEDREVTHHITTYSVRAIDPSTVKSCSSPRYLVAQNVKIEEIGGVYSADITMSIVGTDTRGVLARNDPVVYNMHPYVSFENDLGLSTRNTTMHVFTQGKHYSMLLTHMYNPRSVRSLQLSAYASLNALSVSGNSQTSDIDRIMVSASMETLFDNGDLPVVVARGSTVPFICVMVPGPTQGGDMSITSSVNSPSASDEGLGLTEMITPDTREVPVSTIDLSSLPTPVQNALRRQWGA